MFINVDVLYSRKLLGNFLKLPSQKHLENLLVKM